MCNAHYITEGEANQSLDADRNIKYITYHRNEYIIVSNIRRFARSAYPVDIGVHDSLTCTRLYYFQTLLSSLQDFENRCLGVFHVSSFRRSKKPRLLRPQ